MTSESSKFSARFARREKNRILFIFPLEIAMFWTSKTQNFRPPEAAENFDVIEKIQARSENLGKSSSETKGGFIGLNWSDSPKRTFCPNSGVTNQGCEFDSEVGYMICTIFCGV